MFVQVASPHDRANSSLPCCSSPPRATTTIETQTRNKRIVIIAGRPSHPPGMHEFRAGSLLLQKALAGVKGVTVDVIPMGWPKKTVDGKEVDDHAALDGADAVFIYADGGRNHPAIQNDRVQVIDALATKGVGLAFGHYGVEVPVGEPAAAMHRWVGGYYETNYSANPMWAPNFEKFPSHPVTRGVGPFATHDEWYFNMRWTADEKLKSRIQPLLVATPSEDVRDGPYVSPRGPYDHIIADKGRERDDDVGVRKTGRRPQLRFHGRPHTRDLGRRQSAADRAQRAAVDRQGRRAVARRRRHDRGGRLDGQSRPQAAAQTITAAGCGPPKENP